MAVPNEVAALSMADGALTVSADYSAQNLQVRSVTYQNLTTADAVIDITSQGVTQHTYILAANTATTTANVGSDHIQLVQQTVKGQTIVTWPDGWSMAVRWPA